MAKNVLEQSKRWAWAKNERDNIKKQLYIIEIDANHYFIIQFRILVIDYSSIHSKWKG